MDKEEIEKFIEQEKETLNQFQRFVKRHRIPKEVVQKQIDLYLDTLNKLYEQLKNLEE